MDSRRFRSSHEPECGVCADWPPNEVGLSLKLSEIRVAALNSCARCGLLAECVSPYQWHWSHLGHTEAERVTIVLSRPIIPTTDRLFRVSIRWPCQNNKPRELEIQIAAEVRFNIY